MTTALPALNLIAEPGRQPPTLDVAREIVLIIRHGLITPRKVRRGLTRFVLLASH